LLESDDEEDESGDEVYCEEAWEEEEWFKKGKYL
jgi:hypothetical protein